MTPDDMLITDPSFVRQMTGQYVSVQSADNMVVLEIKAAQYEIADIYLDIGEAKQHVLQMLEAIRMAEAMGRSTVLLDAGRA